MEPWLSPLYDAEGIRAVDRWAIEEQGVPEVELMEAAGTALAEAVAELAPEGPVRILCGKGNNGGDGLVAARHLAGDGLRGRGAGALLAMRPPNDFDAWLAGSGAVVDAIFGTGFAGAPREPAAAAIEAINRCGAPVVACDIASGVDASTRRDRGRSPSRPTSPSASTPRRSATGSRRASGTPASCAWPRSGFPAGRRASAVAGTIEPAVLALAPRRGSRSTKFSSGQVVVAGGSRGLTGAVQMSSLAAIRAGAGYATVAVPADLEPIFEAGQPEVMSVGCPGGDGCLAPASLKAVLRSLRARRGGSARARDGARPRLGRAGPRRRCRDRGAAGDRRRRPQRLRRRTSARSPRAARRRSSPRTQGSWGVCSTAPRPRSPRTASPRRSEAARAAEAVVVLKGDDTIVTDGERVAVNVLSAPGLATAGTGDVLSGIVAALLARGLEPFAAACAAVIAHARAGRDAAARIGAAESVIATDVIASIPLGMVPGAPVE